MRLGRESLSGTSSMTKSESNTKTNCFKFRSLTLLGLLVVLVLTACSSPAPSRPTWTPPPVKNAPPPSADPIGDMIGKKALPGSVLDSMGYGTQVGAFQVLDNAVRLERKLKASGIDAYYFRHESGLYKVRFGNHPEGKNVFDLDSMQLIATMKKMRDDKKFLNDKELDGAPEIFIGAAANPFGDPISFRPMRLAKKVDAGCDFIQTQCIYNMETMREYMKRAVDMGLHEKCYIMGGVTPMKSVGMARYMSKFVPGMDVPNELIKRLQGAGKKNAAAEGIKICIETIQELQEMEGVAGVHVMAIEWEHRAKEIIEGAGLLPRPVLD